MALGIFGGRHDRKGLVAVFVSPVEEPQKHSYSDSEHECKSNEIPESWESQKEDQGAARREKQSNKSAAERNLVHGDTGMPFFSHGTPLGASIILPPSPRFKDVRFVFCMTKTLITIKGTKGKRAPAPFVSFVVYAVFPIH
jgi:hypothetical protein